MAEEDGVQLPVRGRWNQMGSELLPSLSQSPLISWASGLMVFETIVLLLNKV